MGLVARNGPFLLMNSLSGMSNWIDKRTCTPVRKVGRDRTPRPFAWAAVNSARLTHCPVGPRAHRAKERMSTSRSTANSAICLRRSSISARTFSLNVPSPT